MRWFCEENVINYSSPGVTLCTYGIASQEDIILPVLQPFCNMLAQPNEIILGDLVAVVMLEQQVAKARFMQQKLNQTS